MFLCYIFLHDNLFFHWAIFIAAGLSITGQSDNHLARLPGDYRRGNTWSLLCDQKMPTRNCRQSCSCHHRYLTSQKIKSENNLRKSWKEDNDSYTAGLNFSFNPRDYPALSLFIIFFIFRAEHATKMKSFVIQNILT